MCGAFQIQHQRREKDKNKLDVIKIKNSAQGAVKWVRMVCICVVVRVRCMCCVCGACICTHVFGRVKPGRTHTEILRVTRQGLGVWKSFDSHNYLFITRMFFFLKFWVYITCGKLRGQRRSLWKQGGRVRKATVELAGRSRGWGLPALSFGTGKVRSGGGKWRREETHSPLEGLLLEGSGML